MLSSLSGTTLSLWDDVTAAADATAWQWRDRSLGMTLSLSLSLSRRSDIAPSRRPWAIESAGTAAEVAAAVAAAMGAFQLTDAEAAEPFPVADVLPADRVRVDADGWPEVRWAHHG